MYRIESNIKLFSGEDYFVFQETALFTNFDYTKYYNASFQYVIFKNGSLMLSYDYIDYNFPKMETIGINFGDGTFYTAHSFSSNFQHKSFLFNYNYINATHITKVSCSPESGNHLTEFTFSLLFQNLENWGPHAVILTLGGTNYTMSPVSTSDIDYVNGCAYSKMVQFLSPGTSYNHSFHVLTSHGWWHSPPINGPVTADLPRFNYATCKLHYFDNPVLTSPISVSSLFQTINLPFNFTFYGVNFTNLTLSRYGFIRFNTDTSETQPVPGSTASSSRVAITFGDNTVNDGGTAVLYQLFPDKAVFSFPSMTYYGGFNLPLGTYKFILYKSGDIVISFSNLQAILAGGVNMGNGFHFTLINFTQSSVPLVNESFIFLPPRINVPQVAGNVSGTLFKSSESITFQGTYTSSGNIPVVRAWIKIEGCSYKGTTFSAMVYQLTFIATGFTDYRGNARFTLSRMLGSGLYNGTITFIDIYGTRFNTTMIHFSVNDPPDCIADPTSAYGGVGKTLTIRVSYRDPEGFAPASLTIRWDGVNMTMNPSSSDFSSTVYFTRSILLEHGIHNYEIFVKDQHRPETVSVTTTARTINVKHLPVIEILNFPQANVLIPGEFEVKVRITSLEPGFAVADLYVSVNGKQYRDWRQATGEPGTFMASIRLDWGTYIISIAVTDGYNEVVYPAAGSITITVINLPLIIGLILGAGSAIAITLLVQLKRKKAAAAQQARLRQQVLAKKPTRRDIADLVEQKRKDRQEEMKQIDAMDIVQPAPAPIKKSAAIKRATSGTPSNTGATTSPTRVAKPAPSGGTQPKDKSGYSQKVTDTGTVVNRTVLKEYIERKRKEGVRELHYIQIKNDLNVISQKKSSKLYRILQDLVEDEILIRKGSNYVIVG